MSGHKTGLEKLSPLAVFTHCYNQRLNLVVHKIGTNVADYQAILGVTRQVFIKIPPSHRRITWFMDFQEIFEC